MNDSSCYALCLLNNQISPNIPKTFLAGPICSLSCLIYSITVNFFLSFFILLPYNLSILYPLSHLSTPPACHVSDLSPPHFAPRPRPRPYVMLIVSVPSIGKIIVSMIVCKHIDTSAEAPWTTCNCSKPQLKPQLLLLQLLVARSSLLPLLSSIIQKFPIHSIAIDVFIAFAFLLFVLPFKHFSQIFVNHRLAYFHSLIIRLTSTGLSKP